MISPSARPPMQLMRVSSVVFIIALAVPFIQGTSVAEIPHENYDLMDADMAAVVSLLNASIRASEDALEDFYGEDTVSADARLELVDSVLGPAEALLDDMDGSVDSYDDLQVLLPPFAGLYNEMTGFSGLESQLLEVKAEFVELAAMADITDVEAVSSLDQIRLVGSLLARMNTTIDDMLFYAEGIDALVVDNRTVFLPNDLVWSIERLREVTLRLHEEIAQLVEEEMPWDGNRTFMVLWLEDEEVYLGEEVRGGGLLMLNGTFVDSCAVSVMVDGEERTTTSTTPSGSFPFNLSIPVDASWLGTHELTASATPSNTTIVSEAILLTVSLIPTTMTLVADVLAISLPELAVISAMLMDARGVALTTSACVIEVDSEEQAFATDELGRKTWEWEGTSLGFGRHEFVASYAGELPFAPCASQVLVITVDIPTDLTIVLAEDRVNPDDDLEGECRLTANNSTPLSSRTLVLSIDGFVKMNISTSEDGRATFLLDIAGLAPGVHMMSIEFVPVDPIWRGCRNETVFIVLEEDSSHHPFLPWVPGWDIGGDIVDQLRDLFFGEYAYLTWLLVILVVVVVIRALQTRRARRLGEAPMAPAVEYEGEPPSSMWNERPAELVAGRMPTTVMSPNEKVIWYYHSLIAYLKAKVHVGIADNMTHWEVMRFLGTLGYPEGAAGRVASLYEKARYSGTDSTDADVALMVSSSDAVRDFGGVRAAA